MQLRRTASLRRSWRLLRAFRAEQQRPEDFYRLLADDSVRMVGEFAGLDGASVLDVGGGPGFFEDAFTGAGARYVALESDVGELSAHGGSRASRTLLGSGLDLPVADGAFDVVFSSNVAEHVAAPARLADEMVRATRPGGTVVLSYTIWYGLHGGHETSPWHLLGGDLARRRYERRQGRPPKNVYGTSLFPAGAAGGLRWARSHPGAELVAAFPRYHPWWAHRVVDVPVLREVLTWNLVLVLRRR